MSNSLSRAIIRFYEKERFYAEILMQMDRIVTNRIPTAGVCIKDKVQLYINPTFFDSLSEEEQVAVLEHECKHILHNHITRSKEAAPEVYDGNKKDIVDSLINTQKHKLVNIACDMAINPGISNIPSFAVIPEAFNLPEGHVMEWYLASLKDKDKAKELTKYDGHDLWDESEGSKEELKEKIKRVVKEAAVKAQAAGSLSYNDQLLVDRLLHKPRDWKAELKRFAANSLSIKLRSSRKKRNRRYGIMYPGTVKEELLHIGVAIDTSGSVSNEALHQFMAEIGNIAKYAVVTVVEADSAVKNSYVFDPKKKYAVSGRGGTAYQPAFDYFTKETEVDGVIYFGDMDCFDTEAIKKPKYPVLWAIVGEQDPPVKWGSQTRIEIKTR